MFVGRSFTSVQCSKSFCLQNITVFLKTPLPQNLGNPWISRDTTSFIIGNSDSLAIKLICCTSLFHSHFQINFQSLQRTLQKILSITGQSLSSYQMKFIPTQSKTVMTYDNYKNPTILDYKEKFNQSLYLQAKGLPLEDPEASHSPDHVPSTTQMGQFLIWKIYDYH